MAQVDCMSNRHGNFTRWTIVTLLQKKKLNLIANMWDFLPQPNNYVLNHTLSFVTQCFIFHGFAKVYIYVSYKFI